MPEPTGTQYAGFFARLLAFLADTALVFLVSAAILTAAAMALGPDLLMAVAVFVSLIGLLYWPVMHASGVQGTLGKAIVGLKVTRFDGRRISIVRSVWRELSKVFSSAILMLGYLIAAVLPRKQALHDLLAGTYVVREGPSRALLALLIAVVGFALPVVVVPMLVDASVMKRTAAMAESMVPADLKKQIPAPAQDLMKQALGHGRELMTLVLSSIQDLMRPSAPPPPAPKVAQKPAPTPPVAKAPAAKPKPVVEPAKPAAVAEWKKPPAVPESAKLAPVIDEQYPEPLSEAEWRARLKPPAKKVARPVGEWNQGRIVKRGAHVEHWLNGERVVEYELWSDAWKAQVAASKFSKMPAYATSKKGHLALQDHGDPVSFRSLKIKVLPAGGTN